MITKDRGNYISKKQSDEFTFTQISIINYAYSCYDALSVKLLMDCKTHTAVVTQSKHTYSCTLF